MQENIPRVLPDDCKAVIDTSSWTIPPVFQWLKTQGGVAADEMHRTFNCGIGMILAVAEGDATTALDQLSSLGETPVVVGHVASRNKYEEAVELLHLD